MLIFLLFFLRQVFWVFCLRRNVENENVQTFSTWAVSTLDGHNKEASSKKGVANFDIKKRGLVDSDRLSD